MTMAKNTIGCAPFRNLVYLFPARPIRNGYSARYASFSLFSSSSSFSCTKACKILWSRALLRYSQVLASLHGPMWEKVRIGVLENRVMDGGFDGQEKRARFKSI